MADPFGTNGNGRPPFHQYQNDPFDSTRRLDPARNFESMPPNLGRPIMPHVITFQGLISSIAKTYRNPDEAIKHSQQNARFMRQDIGVMECLESRMRSTALLDWHIEVDGPELPYHRALQERVTNILRAMQAAYKAGERDGRKQAEAVAANAVELAVLVEREQCATTCDMLAYEWRGANSQVVACAKAIRLRSNA